jgi:hypothetical protein
LHIFGALLLRLLFFVHFEPLEKCSHKSTLV